MGADGSATGQGRVGGDENETCGTGGDRGNFCPCIFILDSCVK